VNTDVVERIDALVAEEKCPHCERDWHELPLTQQVVRMFELGRLDTNYFTSEDRSPIVCDGSSQYGARRPDPPPYSKGGLIGWGNASFTVTADTAISHAYQYAWDCQP
jgi:hypothetical protein